MSDSLYMISIIHMIKKTLIQYLMRGDMRDAMGLTNAISYGYYKHKQKYVENMIAEITNSAVNICVWNQSEGLPKEYKFTIAPRNPENDIFLIQQLNNEEDDYRIRMEYTAVKSKIKDVLADIRPKRKVMKPYRLVYTVNRISPRGISLMDYKGGGEREVGFTEYTHCKECRSYHFPNGLDVVKL